MGMQEFHFLTSMKLKVKFVFNLNMGLSIENNLSRLNCLLLVNPMFASVYKGTLSRRLLYFD